TGIFSAAQKAAEVVDSCVGRIVEAALKHNYTTFILADHGNSDCMVNEDGSPNTQHSTNPVPLIVVDKNRRWNLKHG
ncbi:hypothetical protein QP511_12075, partial [Rothia aeria]|nr:hypothetical protein [Rothia aeria]